MATDRLSLRRNWAGALTVTTISLQYAALLMTQPSQKAFWNEEETNAMLIHLSSHKSLTEGVGNFKEPVWNAAPEHISSMLTRGPPKTSKMCQTKWASVDRLF
jgi:hypothetical protein